MLCHFQSKITSCLITFYHLRSFALSPANSDLFWFHLKVGKRVNCNKIQPEFKAFSQTRFVFTRCAHNFFTREKRERTRKNAKELIRTKQNSKPSHRQEKLSVKFILLVVPILESACRGTLTSVSWLRLRTVLIIGNKYLS